MDSIEHYRFEITAASSVAFLVVLVLLIVAAILFLRRRHLSGVIEFLVGVSVIELYSIYEFARGLRFEPIRPGRIELMVLVLTFGGLLIVVGIVRLLRNLPTKSRGS
jgi:hypothetical protein